MRLTGIVKEQRVVWPSVLDQPMHSPKNVLLRRLAHGILLVVCKNHHVFPPVSEVLYKVRGHVLDIVDTSSELPALAEVVDADEKGLPTPCTLRILERVPLRCTVAKMLWCCRRWCGGGVVAMNV